MSAVLNLEGVVVRPMREPDLGQIITIEKAAYEFPWSPGIFRDCLRVGYCCWVLEQLDTIDAYGIMQVSAGECHVLNLCVRTEMQGQGLGGQLLVRLMTVGRDHHADTALLEVRPTNDPARKLYARLGFQEVGVRRAYYPGRNGREDALILARPLGRTIPAMNPISPPESTARHPH